MKGLSQAQLKKDLEKKCSGSFVMLNGEEYYKIENYDQMTDFFMTITSSCDVWNTIWSHGGISAGRIDCNHALFPYYTADKIADAKTYTGSYTAVLVTLENEVYVWEPFTQSAAENYQLKRNLYKNTSGSKVYFEEINEDLGLTFRYGWTSSEKFGLVKHSIIQSDESTKLVQVLDGCQNILPACVDADFQNKRSVLLDAYKKTDFDKNSGLALFTVSSVVTDKAEPSEGLYANTAWFSSDGPVYTDPQTARDFILGKPLTEVKTLKGKRASCLQLKNYTLKENSTEEWYQVFDTWLNTAEVLGLQKNLRTKKETLLEELKADIQKNVADLDALILQADGIQNTNDKTICVHHKANVLFNIMRGGIFADNGRIQLADFYEFVRNRNKAYEQTFKKLLRNYDEYILPEELLDFAHNQSDSQIERLCLEYVPLIFSRRHGDPSRPWNMFSIKLKDSKGNRSFNYEGNWRDIFQNWEALCMSYPVYTKNIIAKFLNAMTIDGFNPYRISKDGVDWEIPDPTDPWSNIGYWNDHQVIYLQKLLEFQYQLSPISIYESFVKKLFSTANIPYRLKKYSEILANPRDTVLFDEVLSQTLLEQAEKQGTDIKLVCRNMNAKEVEQVSMLTKLLQIILTKLANFVPGGGIWMNTQRPEWNDANNALAGYGLSMVTLNYLYRMIQFLEKVLRDSPIVQYMIPEETGLFLNKMADLYTTVNPRDLLDWNDPVVCSRRKKFVDAEGFYFEDERDSLYKNGHSKNEMSYSKDRLINILRDFQKHIEATISVNKRQDGLYHTYNTLIINDDKMEIKDLTLMLEGQVAVLSSGYLSCKEAADLCTAMKNSALYVADRNTYILYPNKELPDFWDKNTFDSSLIADFQLAKQMIENDDRSIIYKDAEGNCHFNSDFRNVDFMRNVIDKINEQNPETIGEKDIEHFEALYESVFNHISFTGRSGTFYAYEGLGSVYWHMVAKYLLAVQEYINKAEKEDEKQILVDAYYSIRSGIGFNKTPEEYGAFPTDPYSHTPEGQGAKQPGMTGQVKEEIITRWGELGVQIVKGQILFDPSFLKAEEFDADGKLTFSRFGIKIEYVKSDEKYIVVTTDNGETEKNSGKILSTEVSKSILERKFKVTELVVYC